MAQCMRNIYEKTGSQFIYEYYAARCPGMNILKSGIYYYVVNFSTALKGSRYSFPLM